VVERAAQLAAGFGVDLQAVSVVPDVTVGAQLGGAGAEAITHGPDRRRQPRPRRAGRYVLGSLPERGLYDPHGHDVHVVRTT